MCCGAPRCSRCATHERRRRPRSCFPTIRMTDVNDDAPSQPTAFELVGGEARVREMVDRFYDLMDLGSSSRRFARCTRIRSTVRATSFLVPVRVARRPRPLHQPVRPSAATRAAPAVPDRVGRARPVAALHGVGDGGHRAARAAARAAHAFVLRHGRLDAQPARLIDRYAAARARDDLRLGARTARRDTGRFPNRYEARPMTTQALFREDAYLTQCDAVVLAVGDDGIRLDRTVFYPLGGGGRRHRHADAARRQHDRDCRYAQGQVRRRDARRRRARARTGAGGERRGARAPARAWSRRSTGCAAIATCGCMPQRT